MDTIRRPQSPTSSCIVRIHGQARPGLGHSTTLRWRNFTGLLSIFINPGWIPTPLARSFERARSRGPTRRSANFDPHGGQFAFNMTLNLGCLPIRPVASWRRLPVCTREPRPQGVLLGVDKPRSLARRLRGVVGACRLQLAVSFAGHSVPRTTPLCFGNVTIDAFQGPCDFLGTTCIPNGANHYWPGYPAYRGACL